MPNFERTVTVSASPEEAFQFLAEPRNLPRYVATMSAARPEQGERLHVAADVQGRHEEGDARFSADPHQRRISWASGGASSYEGSIDVSAADGGSSVHIRLHVEHERDVAEINRTMDETVANIERLLGSG
jgi:uncharacterized protein YndB with AHSA1/START domain